MQAEIDEMGEEVPQQEMRKNAPLDGLQNERPCFME